MAALWIISLYYKMVLYFFASVLGLMQILNLKHYRPLIYPLGMIAIVLSLFVFPNVVDQQKFDSYLSKYFSLTIGLLLPLLIVNVYAVSKKQLKKEAKPS